MQVPFTLDIPETYVITLLKIACDIVLGGVLINQPCCD